MTVWTDEMIAIAAGMKRAGLTSKAIAARLGVTDDAAKNRMRKASVKRRLDGKPGGNHPHKQRVMSQTNYRITTGIEEICND